MLIFIVCFQIKLLNLTKHWMDFWLNARIYIWLSSTIISILLPSISVNDKYGRNPNLPNILRLETQCLTYSVHLRDVFRLLFIVFLIPTIFWGWAGYSHQPSIRWCLQGSIQLPYNNRVLSGNRGLHPITIPMSGEWSQELFTITSDPVNPVSTFSTGSSATAYDLWFSLRCYAVNTRHPGPAPPM